jgi:hypothetical protein
MFGKKKKRIKFTMSDMSTRTREFVLDSQIQHGHEVSVLLGCSAISDEGADHEEQESDKRVDRVSYLIPLMYAYSKTLADGVSDFQQLEMPEELKELPEELWLHSRKFLEEFAFSVLVGAMSQIVDMGLVTVPKDKR